MATNSDKLRSGFTLFPSPPSPPNKQIKSRLRRKSTKKVVIKRPALPVVSELSSDDENDPISNELDPHASLKLKNTLVPSRSRNDCYGMTTHDSQTNSNPQIPSSAVRQTNWRRKTSVSLDSPNRPKTQFPWSTSKKIEFFEPRNKFQFGQKGMQNSRQSSVGQINYLVETEHGEVDRKKLSMYLGNVLNASFQMPDLTTEPIPIPEPLPLCCMDPENQMVRGLQSLHSPLIQPSDTNSKRCRCQSGSVICQCSSSPEFKSFRRVRNDHKSQSSVSSTRCLVNIPRARFKTVFLDIEIPESMDIPNMWSPPGLSFTSDSSKEDRDSFEWSLPGSPELEDDPFVVPKRTSRSENTKVTHTRQRSRSEDGLVHARNSSDQSFSRPFMRKSPSLYEGIQSVRESKLPTMKHSEVSELEKKKHSHLGSMDTLSTFDFEFEAQQKNRQENEPQGSPSKPSTELRRPTSQASPQTPTRSKGSGRSQTPSEPSSYFSAQSTTWSHKHNSSSTCSSIFEVIELANTAVIAQATPAKAVMVVNTNSSKKNNNKQNIVATSMNESSLLQVKMDEEEYWRRQIEHEEIHLFGQSQTQPPRRTLTVRNPDRVDSVAVVLANESSSSASSPPVSPTLSSSCSSEPNQQTSITKNIPKSPRMEAPKTPPPPPPIPPNEYQYSRRLELGQSRDFTYNRSVTSDGSPVLGRAKLVIVS